MISFRFSITIRFRCPSVRTRPFLGLHINWTQQAMHFPTCGCFHLRSQRSRHRSPTYSAPQHAAAASPHPPVSLLLPAPFLYAWAGGNTARPLPMWGYDPGYPRQITWAAPPGVAQPKRRSLAGHGAARRVSQDTGKIS